MHPGAGQDGVLATAIVVAVRSAASEALRKGAQDTNRRMAKRKLDEYQEVGGAADRMNILFSWAIKAIPFGTQVTHYCEAITKVMA